MGVLPTDTRQYASLASPPDKPPMAMPGVFRFAISWQQIWRRPRSRPPWMMQKRFCRSGYLCAAMHRSSQRTERRIASSIRAASGDVAAITSSNCMMISEPMEFCNEIECSGVRSLFCGDCRLAKDPSSEVQQNTRTSRCHHEGSGT